MEVIGIFLFLIGACCMDSKDLTIPIVMCLIGAVTATVGIRKRSRAN